MKQRLVLETFGPGRVLRYRGQMIRLQQVNMTQHTLASIFIYLPFSLFLTGCHMLVCLIIFASEQTLQQWQVIQAFTQSFIYCSHTSGDEWLL